jgi:hypothetical protein
VLGLRLDHLALVVLRARCEEKEDETARHVASLPQVVTHHEATTPPLHLHKKA